MAPASTNLVAYATLDLKTILVTPINKAHGSGTTNLQVQIKLDASVDTANVIYLDAKNGDIASGSSDLTIGGAPINEDGSWHGHWTQVATVTNNLISISLPPASAAVVRVNLR